MALDTFPKDPDAVLDYSIDWSIWLATAAETLVTSTWTVPTGLTKASESNTTTVATVWLSGGTAGTTYAIVNRVTTSGGRTDERTLNIVVSNR